MYYSSPQIDPVRNAVSSSEQTSLRCSSLPTQRARCTDRHAESECVCVRVCECELMCVPAHTHTHCTHTHRRSHSGGAAGEKTVPNAWLFFSDQLMCSPLTNTVALMWTVRDTSLSLVSPVSHSSFPALPVPFSPSHPSTLPPATFVPFNVANDCRSFSLLFTLQLSC